MRFNIAWLTDWSVVDALPSTIQKLSICSLHLQSFDRNNTDKPSLQAFNALVNRVELDLVFQGNFEGVPNYNMVVEGDLALPSLQVLRLCRSDIGLVLHEPIEGYVPADDYSPVVLAHFTGAQIPRDCFVICHELIETPSKQAWMDCCWYDFRNICIPFDNIVTSCRLA